MAKNNSKRFRKDAQNKYRLAEQLRGLDLERVLIVPVDVAKKNNKALTADYYGKVFDPPFSFDNNRTGVDKFTSIVEQTAAGVKAQRVIIAMEPTGHYYEPLCHTLCMLESEIRLVNTLSVAVQRKGDLEWCKSDDKDLVAIGQAVINNRSTLFSFKPAVYENLLLLVRARNQHVAARSALKCQIKGSCDRLFPGLSSSGVFSDFWSGAPLAIMEKYPSPLHVMSVGKSRIKTFLRSRGMRPSCESVEKLIRLAREALTPSASTSDTLQRILAAQIKQYKSLCGDIIFFETQMAPLLASTPGILLLSIPYINVTTAAEYIAELGDPARYSRAKSIIRRAGLNPSFSQSGAWESSRSHITKQGHPALRAAIMKIAKSISSDNPFYYSIYDHIVSREKDAKKQKEIRKHAWVVVATHFTRHSFAMMSNNKLFAPENWNGAPLTDDPVKKITRYLQDRDAGDLIETTLKSAASQLPAVPPKQLAKQTCKPASQKALKHIGSIIEEIRTRLEKYPAVAQLPE